MGKKVRVQVEIEKVGTDQVLSEIIEKIKAYPSESRTIWEHHTNEYTSWSVTSWKPLFETLLFHNSIYSFSTNQTRNKGHGDIRYSPLEHMLWMGKNKIKIDAASWRYLHRNTFGLDVLKYWPEDNKSITPPTVLTQEDQKIWVEAWEWAKSNLSFDSIPIIKKISTEQSIFLKPVLSYQLGDHLIIQERWVNHTLHTKDQDVILSSPRATELLISSSPPFLLPSSHTFANKKEYEDHSPLAIQKNSKLLVKDLLTEKENHSTQKWIKNIQIWQDLINNILGEQNVWRELLKQSHFGTVEIQIAQSTLSLEQILVFSMMVGSSFDQLPPSHPLASQWKNFKSSLQKMMNGYTECCAALPPRVYPEFDTLQRLEDFLLTQIKSDNVSYQEVERYIQYYLLPDPKEKKDKQIAGQPTHTLLPLILTCASNFKPKSLIFAFPQMFSTESNNGLSLTFYEKNDVTFDKMMGVVRRLFLSGKDSDGMSNHEIHHLISSFFNPTQILNTGNKWGWEKGIKKEIEYHHHVMRPNEALKMGGKLVPCPSLHMFNFAFQKMLEELIANSSKNVEKYKHVVYVMCEHIRQAVADDLKKTYPDKSIQELSFLINQKTVALIVVDYLNPLIHKIRHNVLLEERGASQHILEISPLLLSVPGLREAGDRSIWAKEIHLDTKAKKRGSKIQVDDYKFECYVYPIAYEEVKKNLFSKEGKFVRQKMTWETYKNLCKTNKSSSLQSEVLNLGSPDIHLVQKKAMARIINDMSILFDGMPEWFQDQAVVMSFPATKSKIYQSLSEKNKIMSVLEAQEKNNAHPNEVVAEKKKRKI